MSPSPRRPRLSPVDNRVGGDKSNWSSACAGPRRAAARNRPHRLAVGGPRRIASWGNHRVGVVRWRRAGRELAWCRPDPIVPVLDSGRRSSMADRNGADAGLAGRQRCRARGRYRPLSSTGRAQRRTAAAPTRRLSDRACVSPPLPRRTNHPVGRSFQRGAARRFGCPPARSVTTPRRQPRSRSRANASSTPGEAGASPVFARGSRSTTRTRSPPPEPVRLPARRTRPVPSPPDQTVPARSAHLRRGRAQRRNPSPTKRTRDPVRPKFIEIDQRQHIGHPGRPVPPSCR